MPTTFKIPESLKNLETTQDTQPDQLVIPEDEIDDTLFSEANDPQIISRHLTEIQNRCVEMERPYEMIEDNELIYCIYTFLKLWDKVTEYDDRDAFVDLMLTVLNRLLSCIGDIKVAILDNETTRLQFQNSLKMVVYFLFILQTRLSEEDNNRWEILMAKYKNKTRSKANLNEMMEQVMYGGKREGIIQGVLDLINDHWTSVRHCFHNKLDRDFTDTLMKIGVAAMESVIRMDDKIVREGIFLYSTKVARVCEPFSDNLGALIFERIQASETLSMYMPQFIQQLTQEEGRAEGGTLITDVIRACVNFEYEGLGVAKGGARSVGAAAVPPPLRHCQFFVEECSKHCPAVFVPQLDMLQKNLVDFNIANVRTASLDLLRAIAVDVLGQKTDDASRNTREKVLDAIEERLHDINSFTRARAIHCWEILVDKKSAPLDFLSRIIELSIRRLRDSSALVRKHAVNFLIAAIDNNPFGKVLQKERFQARMTHIDQVLQTNFRQMTKEDIENQEREKLMCEHAVPFIDKMQRALEEIYPMLEAKSSIDVQAAIKFATTACMYGLDSTFKGMRTYFKLVWGATGSDTVLKTMIDCFSDFFLSYPLTNKDSSIVAVLTLLKMLALCSEEDMVSLKQVLRVCVQQGLWKQELTIALFELFQMKYPDVRSVETSASLAVMMLEMLAAIDPSIVRDYQKTFFRVLKENFQHFGLTCINIFEALFFLRNVEEEPPFEPDHKWMKLIQVVLNDRTFLITDWLAIAQKGIALIFHLCSRPDEAIDALFFKFSQTFNSDRNDWVALTKLVFLLGESALNDLVALDNQHKREIVAMRLKYREVKESNKSGRKKKDTAKRGRKKKDSPKPQDTLEKELGMGGEEMDTAEIDQRFKMLKHSIFQRKDMYTRLLSVVEQATSPTVEKVLLRKIAVITKAKLCIVSRQFCKQHLLSVVTVMANPTAPPDLRCNLIAIMADIISIHTNDSEGYTSNLFQCLNDEKLVVRKDAMLAVTHLVLNGMLMVSTNIGYLARCVVDPDEFINHSAKSFFYHFHQKHSEKYNPIYNHAPDCISTLSALSEKELPYSEFCKIMRFMFSFIRKEAFIKSMTNTLTNRFAIVRTDDPSKIRKWKCIAFCLSLMKMQKQTFLVLMDNFNSYKHVLPESVEIKNTFLEIIRNHKKTLTTAKDVAAYKEQIAKFEESIVNVIEKEDDEGGDEAEIDEELEEYEEELVETKEIGDDDSRRHSGRKRKSSDSGNSTRNSKRRKQEESDKELDAAEDDKIDFELDTEKKVQGDVQGGEHAPHHEVSAGHHHARRRKSRLSAVKPEPRSSDDEHENRDDATLRCAKMEQHSDEED
mmetsp:Transcript_8480/g.31391  ORF Transcript_8480/g.31391 Transcript_8480/m.31391 type:complete len:1336 (-) Transcript_8480:1149-5156(-)|eukprot:CAMPEP_0117440418 /NCGR_PEP_ID=MMETSP0759-20121206/3087_1 /TAXON_ID=63605 /ORGANISM="Percolomonas cosmopolitus, Strain WS" /LENGTH=1335 /DNA_ID=CAMNT_0005232197 /DNA_START=246 /DNA_END=4253 /DNA_ORIENTATION=+